MPRESAEVELPGVEGKFIILQLPGEQSFYLLLDILAVVAPGAAKSLKEAQGLDLGKLDVAALSDALQGFFSKANRDEVKRITGELFRYVEWVGAEGKLMLSVKGSLDKIFTGNPLGIFLLQKEVLRLNYAGFFKGLGGLVAAAVAKGKSKLPSVESTTSGGPSGDSSPSESLDS